MPVLVRRLESADISSCERILSVLPGWFGIEESNRAYVASLERLPAYVATDDDEVVGFLALASHTPAASEIHVMAVHPERHRAGIGRALVSAAIADLGSAGAALLQVKTLGPSDPDEGYRRTRAFYEAMGFLPLEETTAFWGSDNPTLIMVRPL